MSIALRGPCHLRHERIDATTVPLQTGLRRSGRKAELPADIPVSAKLRAELLRHGSEDLAAS